MAKRSDIVVAKVYFSDSPDGKLRPCIVLSDERYNSSGFALVAPITTSGDEYCLPIGKSDCDCDLAGGSGARFDGIAKIPLSQIRHRIGRTKDGFYWKLASKIRELIE
ncbi:MAG: type II toxin-antitoxin system PemK/MazF family toxin [Candidatus Micrarchaeota archaeon]|nr:type II toxin-antitoxin system PemK/MazF family toxin [Candidatus Micrarchaeota archaeon]